MSQSDFILFCFCFCSLFFAVVRVCGVDGDIGGGSGGDGGVAFILSHSLIFTSASSIIYFIYSLSRIPWCLFGSTTYCVLVCSTSIKHVISQNHAYCIKLKCVCVVCMVCVCVCHVCDVSLCDCIEIVAPQKRVHTHEHSKHREKKLCFLNNLLLQLVKYIPRWCVACASVNIVEYFALEEAKAEGHNLI